MALRVNLLSKPDLLVHGKMRKMPIVSKASGGCCGGSSDPQKLSMPNLDYKIAESCCSSGTSNANSCESSSSKSGSKEKGLENVGKEFEALVAQQTMLEMEKQFNLKEMEGKISKDIMQEAMKSAPKFSAGETFIDVDQLVDEAGDSDFVFDPEIEDMVMI